MALTNMKRAPREDADEMAMEEPDYPWGLRVRLNDEELDKLGMADLPAVGAEMQLMAKVSVVSVAQHEDDSKDGKHRDVELQITDMGLDVGENRASIMYPDAE